MSHVTSRIPAATDALVSILAAAIGSTVNVVDGPPLSWEDLSLAQDAVTQEAFLFIGAVPDVDTAMGGTQDFNDAGAVSRDERFTIHCTAYTLTGAQVVKTVRDSTFSLVASVEQAIRNDPSLSEAVLYSRLAGITAVAQRQTEQGADCTVTFTVACRAYLD